MEAFEIGHSALVRLEQAAVLTARFATVSGEPMHTAREAFMALAAKAFDDAAETETARA